MKLSVCKQDRGQSGTTHSSSVYSSSRGKTCAGTILLSFEHNWLKWSCHMTHVTNTIRRDNWLGFKSLWLGLRIRAYGQVLGLEVQCLELGFSLQDT